MEHGARPRRHRRQKPERGSGEEAGGREMLTPTVTEISRLSPHRSAAATRAISDPRPPAPASVAARAAS
jgi:hypothetical protein